MQVWWRMLNPKNIRYRKQERHSWGRWDFNSGIYHGGGQFYMSISKPLEG